MNASTSRRHLSGHRGAVRCCAEPSARVRSRSWLLHGGALTVASAVHLPEVAAAVCFYGMPPKEFAIREDPHPVSGHFANRTTGSPRRCRPDRGCHESGGQKPEIYRYERSMRSSTSFGRKCSSGSLALPGEARGFFQSTSPLTRRQVVPRERTSGRVF